MRARATMALKFIASVADYTPRRRSDGRTAIIRVEHLWRFPHARSPELAPRTHRCRRRHRHDDAVSCECAGCRPAHDVSRHAELPFGECADAESQWRPAAVCDVDARLAG